MKYIVFFLMGFSISSAAKADVDIYQWCQVQNDSIKTLMLLPVKALRALKRSVALAETVKEFSQVVRKDYTILISTVQKHQGISYEKAEKETLTLLKGIEIMQIDTAVDYHSINGSGIMDAVFNKCVKDNS